MVTDIKNKGEIGESIESLNTVMSCVKVIMDYHLGRDGCVPLEIAQALFEMLEVVSKRVKRIADEMEKSEGYKKVFDQIEKALNEHNLLIDDENVTE